MAALILPAIADIELVVRDAIPEAAPHLDINTELRTAINLIAVIIGACQEAKEKSAVEQIVAHLLKSFVAQQPTHET